MKQVFCTAPALSLVFATLVTQNDHLLQIERPARSRVKVVDLDEKRNAERAEASSRVELCLQEGLSLM